MKSIYDFISLYTMRPQFRDYVNLKYIIKKHFELTKCFDFGGEAGIRTRAGRNLPLTV